MAKLTKQKFNVIVEKNAGLASNFSDADYEASGANIVGDYSAVAQSADILLKVRFLGFSSCDF